MGQPGGQEVDVEGGGEGGWIRRHLATQVPECLSIMIPSSPFVVDTKCLVTWRGSYMTEELADEVV